jgi:S-adenosylmethionine:tRNA ribosyltransferase-isomerase
LAIVRRNFSMNFPFNFTLSPQLIAQQPCEPRDRARLLVARRATGELAHHHFFELPQLLRPGDLLILNDTRVLPARLVGKRQRTGGKWEGLYLRQPEPGVWEMMCQTRGRLEAGEIIGLEPGPLTLKLLAKTPEGRWRAEPQGTGDTHALLMRHGHTPLPPYIRKGQGTPGDVDRYQTVYARQAGAVAAPTAGLHFTPEVFAGLKERGIAWRFVTLHVGLGTFQPIQVEDYTQHPMHEEWGQITDDVVAAIRACKENGGRVVAVGTTAVRVLETAAAGGELRAWSGETRLFIHPPYRFRVVEALITNFHLPRTTLLLLVAAFTGVELVERAYRAAIEGNYRFYSYGDAMLVE